MENWRKMYSIKEGAFIEVNSQGSANRDGWRSIQEEDWEVWMAMKL